MENRTATLTIEYDLLTSSMKIGGKVPSEDIALAMLQQAIREFEDRRRLAKVNQLFPPSLPAKVAQDIARMAKG